MTPTRGDAVPVTDAAGDTAPVVPEELLPVKRGPGRPLGAKNGIASRPSSASTAKAIRSASA